MGDYSAGRMSAADWINSLGNEYRDRDRLRVAGLAYGLASFIAPQWNAPWFNRGLVAKSQRRWADCMAFNRKAATLDPNDPPAWWNLGIAATALGDWKTAREAWSRYGISVPEGAGPIDMNLGLVPIRVSPAGNAEVVWCRRLDPARALIRNVPMAESGRGYGDLVLHDGEPKGTRSIEGREVPVFDELQLLTPGRLHTFRVTVTAPAPADVEELDASTVDDELQIEDWTSSLRWLCKSCSEGSPHEHCGGQEDDGWREERLLGVAAASEESVRSLLSGWSRDGDGRALNSVECVLARSRAAAD